MRIAGETVGVRGFALLAATGVVGIVLAVHGWSARHDGLPPTLAGPQASRSPSAGATRVSTVAPTQGPTASGHAAPQPTTASPAPGPKLSSQPYGRYAYQVWPGPMSQAARAAMTGLVVIVHRHGSGIVVAAGAAGQPRAAPTVYPSGARVYVIEAALGDDSNNTDFNFGDDALVVTDSLGRILR
jgi:hypothetical protein